MELNKIHNMDCIEGMKLLPDNSIDSIVTDPPYEIGFMGKSWDSTGIANNPLMWAECLRVLKPGGHLLAFSGTRTYHRMASAIEDAGFEVRDMIEWVYGSGFPKSLNIGKAVDKLQGNEREDLGIRTDIHSHGANCRKTDVIYPTKEPRLTKGTSEWEGWGTALKPAHEPICMARKPLAEKTVAENVLKYGTGGINIDESRVGTDTITVNRHSGYNSNSLVESTKGKWKGEQEQVSGRFPANLIHDNSEEVRECFPEQKSGAKKANQEMYNHDDKEFVATLGASVNEYQASSGNASRFFKSILYYPKASKSERNKGCEELEGKFAPTMGDGIGVKEHNPETATPKQNFHPTVKPIALMEYLIKMVTKEGGTVLDPFTGSGTTLVAATKNHYKYIGFELNKDYCEIAEKRIEGMKGELGLFSD